MHAPPAAPPPPFPQSEAPYRAPYILPDDEALQQVPPASDPAVRLNDGAVQSRPGTATLPPTMARVASISAAGLVTHYAGYAEAVLAPWMVAPAPLQPQPKPHPVVPARVDAAQSSQRATARDRGTRRHGDPWPLDMVQRHAAAAIGCAQTGTGGFVLNMAQQRHPRSCLQAGRASRAEFDRGRRARPVPEFTAWGQGPGRKVTSGSASGRPPRSITARRWHTRTAFRWPTPISCSTAIVGSAALLAPHPIRHGIRASRRACTPQNSRGCALHADHGGSFRSLAQRGSDYYGRSCVSRCTCTIRRRRSRSR
jgi:hypothetical protein